MINIERIHNIVNNYKNPWDLIAHEFHCTILSREDILDIVNIFNREAEYK